MLGTTPRVEMSESNLAVEEARTAAASRDWDKARTALSRGIDLSPNDPELHAQMSYYTSKCGNLEPNERGRLVEHHLSVSFEIAPDNVFAHYYQGRILAEQGNSARGRLALEAALRVRPDFKPATEALEKLIAGKGVTTEVVPAYKTRSRRKQIVTGGGIGLVVLGLAAVGVMYFATSRGDRELKTLAAQLHSPLPIQSASQVGEDLHVDLGEEWLKAEEGTKQGVATTICENALNLGAKHVYLYANSEPVGEGHDGVACLEEKCRTMPSMSAQPTPPPASPAPTK